MKIHRKSVWSQKEIFNYLDKASIPLRIACNEEGGYPVICSLWFIHDDGVLWSASHKNSHIIKLLQRNAKIGLEVATNERPYHGVRGRANVELVDDSAGIILSKVIEKYLQGGNKELSTWLLSRKQDEYALKIKPTLLNSWDFSSRMEPD